MKHVINIFIRCRGVAVNYHVSVSGLQDCSDACDRDERCCHYSYHRSRPSHPDHNHCFLYSSGECDTDKFRVEAGWRTGKRSTVSRSCRQIVNSLWPQVSGESDMIYLI